MRPYYTDYTEAKLTGDTVCSSEVVFYLDKWKMDDDICAAKNVPDPTGRAPHTRHSCTLDILAHSTLVHFSAPPLSSASQLVHFSALVG